MFFSNAGAYSPLEWFFQALAIAAFVVEVWAFADAVRRPAPAFVAASKQTKPLWLVILGVALVIGVGGAVGKLNLLSILPIIAFVAAASRPITACCCGAGFRPASRAPGRAMTSTCSRWKAIRCRLRALLSAAPWRISAAPL